jgi:hypothetical protein
MDPITQQAVLATAGAAGGDKVYVDDVFSTFLYDGNDSTNQIINDIDLAGEGGLVWLKPRTVTGGHTLYDTERGAGNYLTSDGTAANYNLNTYFSGYGLTSFNNNGFTLGANWTGENANNNPQVSWTFRKAPGFFDVVTWSGNGTAGRQISHNLGSVPGCIIVKSISGTAATGQWTVYHRGVPNAQTSYDFHLNAASKPLNGYNGYWDGTVPTTTNFTVGADTYVNGTGTNYVAYIFAHDDASFGTAGNESIIKCGSYTGNGSATGPTINLGFEPQWLMIKPAQNSGGWMIFDNMRGVVTGGNDKRLEADASGAEITADTVDFNSTGFTLTSTSSNSNTSGNTYIYMAIRRPNKPPTAATEVFKATLQSSANPFNVGFPTDMAISSFTATGDRYLQTRLTNASLLTNVANAATTSTNPYFKFDLQNSYTYGAWLGSSEVISFNFKRAPGFFDVVCYNANGGTTQSLNHNLGVEPELMIFKSVGFSNSWWVYVKNLGANKVIGLNDNIEVTTSLTWLNNTAPTSSVFTLGSGGYANWHGTNTDKRCIAYLFASLPGISKVGSYSGSSSAVNVDCGFTAGARFVLIKRTNANSSPGSINGDWYVYDTAKGIVSGNDPYIFLNTNGAQVTNTDYIDPLTSGFTVTSSAPAALNENGGSYIFLAIA